MEENVKKLADIRERYEAIKAEKRAAKRYFQVPDLNRWRYKWPDGDISNEIKIQMDLSQRIARPFYEGEAPLEEDMLLFIESGLLRPEPFFFAFAGLKPGESFTPIPKREVRSAWILPHRDEWMGWTEPMTSHTHYWMEKLQIPQR